tara:strand:- start:58 stop:534 length:477 start_codon:yes stop_codon:yes gene_type:complete
LVGAIASELFGQPDQANPSTNGKSQESWATPRADKYTAENLESWEKRHKEGKVSQQPLPTQVQNWPTMHMGGNDRGAYHDKTGKGQRYLVDKVVDEEAKQQNWPTPRETMSRDVDHDRGKGNLGEKVQSKGMKLNPNWVEQLMGLPVGWTQLPTAWIG